MGLIFLIGVRFLLPEFDVLVSKILSCTRCSLSEKRTRAVPGEGSHTSGIVFIGEGPGFYEDQEGRPFVGRAGKLLDELLGSIGLRRQDVYITNMIKCRAPNNRDPLPGEIQACKPYLDKELEMITPRVVVTLGRYSFSRFFPNEPIGKARGKLRHYNGLSILPMYHPAAALRNGNLRVSLEEDFAKLLAFLTDKPREAYRLKDDQVDQLSLF